MKRLLVSALAGILTVIGISCGKKDTTPRTGCKDVTASNYDSQAEKDCNGCCLYPKKKGALLFWTSNASILTSCGAITVKLSNGQQANVTGYYFTAATDCVNRFGGYFYVEEGTYTYQASTGNTLCGSVSGTVTVTGERCNLVRIN